MSRAMVSFSGGGNYAIEKEAFDRPHVSCGACGQTLSVATIGSLRRGGCSIWTEGGTGLTISADGQSVIIGKDSAGITIVDLIDAQGDLHRCQGWVGGMTDQGNNEVETEIVKTAAYGLTAVYCVWPRWLCRLTFHRFGPHFGEDGPLFTLKP